MSIDHLLCVVDAYCAATGLAEATVSAKFLSRGNRVRELRQGGDMGSRNVVKVIEKFSNEWPASVAWPEGVARPAASLTDSASASSPFQTEAAE